MNASVAVPEDRQTGRELVVWQPLPARFDYAALAARLFRYGRTGLMVWGGVSLLGVGAWALGVPGGTNETGISRPVALAETTVASPAPVPAAASPAAAKPAPRIVGPAVTSARPAKPLPAAPSTVAASPAPARPYAPPAPVRPASEPVLAAVVPAAPPAAPASTEAPALPAPRPALAADPVEAPEQQVATAPLPRPRPEAPVVTGSLKRHKVVEERRREAIRRFGPPPDYYRLAQRFPFGYAPPRVIYFDR